ncbi:hypothetical protein OSB04_002629 [Centaurea solstitialis]|uniref:Uncharacterized protein n=1 Tax=Centaurea solstitialis TaxID=347529 RepID=A0AA38UBK3_9ASTR|nr:hypothetical protein OSB04_002629 [Centaurea solstitialis]
MENSKNPKNERTIYGDLEFKKILFYSLQQWQPSFHLPSHKKNMLNLVPTTIFKTNNKHSLPAMISQI